MRTRKSFFLLFTCNLVLLSVVGYGQPQQIHLSWNSESKDATATSMAVTWADTKGGDATIKYGAGMRQAKSALASRKYSDSGKINIYKVTLKGLKPNTSYSYTCGSDKNGWSERFSFKTAPMPGSREKFVVGVWGDTQDNEFNEQFQKTALIVDQLSKYPIQFTVHMGDIVDNGSVGSKWKGLFAVTQPVNARAPLMSVTGITTSTTTLLTKDIRNRSLSFMIF